MSQLTDAQIFEEPRIGINSVAIIVQHLYGNMKSRWTDFLTSDGEKSWRERDQEFELHAQTREEILQLWEQGWNFLFEAMDQVNFDPSQVFITIRGEKHSVEEAFIRQLAHYASHIGQIIYIAKYFTEDQWQTLSIPKGGSAAFNEEKKKKNQF